MLTIDGSHGEGGGQLLRTTIALSAIRGMPVTIVNIREHRKKPGLAAQHIAAVHAVAGTCSGTCTGLAIRSRKLTFTPGRLKYQDISVAVGTAGSIPLVIQAWLPVALCSGGRLSVTGGTEVDFSPTIDYVDRVLAGVLRRAGAEIRIRVLKRGYYPAGGGEVEINVVKKDLSPIVPDDGRDQLIQILSCSSNLPDQVTARQASAAAAVLDPDGTAECVVTRDIRPGPGTGSSCTVYRGGKGGCAVGRRGLPAETVGRAAAMAVAEELQSPATVDIHLSDQLLLPVALFSGSYSARIPTLHADTVLWLLQQFGLEVQRRTGNTVEYSVWDPSLTHRSSS